MEAKVLRQLNLRPFLSALLLAALASVGALAGPAAQASPAMEGRQELSDAIAVLDLWVEEQRAHRGLPGIVLGVVLDDELIWSQGYGVADLESQEPMTPRSILRIGSVTKLFTATAILHLRDAGKLRLDDPVTRYLPWFRIASPFEEAPAITVRHLLTHTSGLPRESSFPYWTDHEFPTLEQIRAALPEQTAIYPPATHYKYSNLGIALLGEIVAVASGAPYEDYVARHIFAPLGMKNSSARPTEELRGRMATGYGRRLADGSREILPYYATRALAPAANVVSNLEDLARFAALQFGEGKASGSQILAGSTLREMHRPHWVNSSWTGGRGLGFAVSRRDDKTVVYHGGWVAGNRTHLLTVPSEKIAVIAITNADDGSPSFFARRVYNLLAPALRAMSTPATRPKPVVDTARWQRYLGRYTDPWGWEYQVMIRGDQLLLYEHSYPPEDTPQGGLTFLEPVSEDTFRMGDGELVVFEFDDAGTDGKVVRIRRRYDYIFPIGAEQRVPNSAAVGRDDG